MESLLDMLSEATMRITMIGHSTLLLEGTGTRLLTDPYFGTFGHVAYARVGAPAIEREALSDVDGVLVSHSHWDHTDRRFFRTLDRETPVLVPGRTSFVFRLKGVKNPVPLRPWERREIGDATITAVPATHLARTAGFVIELDGVTAYFAGDTYHRAFMKEIGEQFAIDVAMMPVTTFLIPPTMGERGAVAAARDLRPCVVIPIHLGIRPRSFFLRGRQSIDGFERRLRDAGLSADVVRLRGGESWSHDAAARARAAS